MNLRNKKGKGPMAEMYAIIDPVRRAARLRGSSTHSTQIQLSRGVCDDGRFYHWWVLL